jgi:hypothetical protein
MEDLKAFNPEMKVKIELLGNVFEGDGELLDLDGDVGARMQWIDPMTNAVVIKAHSNEVE